MKPLRPLEPRGPTEILAERLCDALDLAADELRRRIAAKAADLRAVAGQFVTVDTKGSRLFEQSPVESPHFVGRTASRRGSGRLLEFTADRIRSVAVVDPDKNVVGVRYPSKLRDSKTTLTFTRKGYSKIRSEYTEAFTTFSSSPMRRLLERILPLARRPKWSFGRSWPAPWPNEKLIFTRAHAGPHGYTIHVEKKLVGNLNRWVRVRVDGKTYGNILAANEHFNAAYARIRAEAGSEPVVANIIQMSCSPARGPAAQESFESVNSAGIGTFDVYAPKSDQYTFWSESRGDVVRQEAGGMTEQAVKVRPDVEGMPTPWQVYRAARDGPGTPG